MAFANLGKDRVRSLPLNQIMVNPAQPRTHFEEEALQQLAQSIARLQRKGACPAALNGLTDRERDICLLIAQRLRNREIAEKLFLTEGSVKQYLNQIYSKLHFAGDARTKREQLIALVNAPNP